MISREKVSTLSELVYWMALNNKDQIFSILDTLPDSDLQSLRISTDLLSNTLNQALEERHQNGSYQLHLGL